MSRDEVLEVSALAKRYREREAVESVSFHVLRGEIFGLLGPNGAGKTTTIGMVAGIVPPTAGAVRLSGKLGLVPQRVALYPSLTAEENLEFFGRVYGLPASLRRVRTEALLAASGLASRRHDRVCEFSAGMKRRLNLVCGIVHEPDLVLLDEPTVGVDPQSRERIYETLSELAGKGCALLLTTHYMDEAERLANRLAILDEGRIVAEGTVAELVRRAGLDRRVEITFVRPPGEALRRKLRSLGGEAGSETLYRLGGSDPLKTLPELLALAAAEGNDLRELDVHRANLGDVFLQLTGKALRD